MEAGDQQLEDQELKVIDHYTKNICKINLKLCNLSIFSDPVIKFNFNKDEINGFITQSGKD